MTSYEVTSGFITGIISSIMFNPIDKLIFTSCLSNQSLFDRNIWCNLYKGTFNTIITRIITSGLYFSYIDHYSNITENKFDVALYTAFMCNITSPIQLIKFHSWHNNLSSMQSIMSIYKFNGILGFTRGAFALGLRDFIFNSIYLNFKEKDKHLYNLSIISIGIIVTSPINLIKNKKYATNESIKQIIKSFKFSQLGLGLSIGRNCLSFYASQLIYDNCKKILK
jgi:hypothetical protein